MKAQNRSKKYLCWVFITVVGVVLLLISPYIIYMSWLLGGSISHQIEWQISGSPNYVIKTELVALTPISGISVLTVKHGDIESVAIEKTQFPTDKPVPQDYQKLTIDGMFQFAYICAKNYPELFCTFQYDPQFGYPKNIKVDCPNPDTCYERYETINVLDIRMLP